MGKPTRTGTSWEEYQIGDGDLLTVHYDSQKVVKVIQLYFSNSKKAPTFADVLGNAEIQQKANGAKYARQDINAEHFWITMYQSKTGDVTTITISRSH